MPDFKTSEEKFQRLQQRLTDPLVTALTIMLAILMFVVGPLQAAGYVQAQHFGIAFAFVLVAAVFIVSGSALAVGAILTAIALILVATVLRLRYPSNLDIFLDASAWLIAGLTLGAVVARAVFAGARLHSIGSSARCCYISPSASSSCRCSPLWQL